MTTNSANTANAAIAKEAVETNGAQSQQTDPPTLQLDNVSYAYTKGGKRVLKNISHDFQAGKVHAITGPSGAGKTTLLSLISGLANPTEGMVLVDGTDLSERDRYRFRSHDIGVIFQSFNLLSNLTVAENIILSMDASGKSFDKPKKAIVEELLKQVHLPKEYANERILHLSGGEQQRVAIARALSYGPSIIVADEPRQSRPGHPGRHHGYFPNVGARWASLRHHRHAQSGSGEDVRRGVRAGSHQASQISVGSFSKRNTACVPMQRTRMPYFFLFRLDGGVMIGRVEVQGVPNTAETGDRPDP